MTVNDSWMKQRNPGVSELRMVLPRETGPSSRSLSSFLSLLLYANYCNDLEPYCSIMVIFIYFLNVDFKGE